MFSGSEFRAVGMLEKVWDLGFRRQDSGLHRVYFIAERGFESFEGFGGLCATGSVPGT